MRKRIAVLAVFVMCSGFALAQTEAEVRERIVGTWKLVATEWTMKDGTTRPYAKYGAHGKGFLMYARDGYMCADLGNPERGKWADTNHPTKEEGMAAAEGTFAYCGKYEIDVAQSRLVHLPEVATDPGYVGSRQIRPYKFEEGRLVLSDVETQEPGVARWKIVWEKVR
jgi:hypothetical protein